MIRCKKKKNQALLFQVDFICGFSNEELELALLC